MLKIGTGICLRNLALCLSKPSIINTVKKEGILLNSQPTRNTGFFNKLTQEQLWKGVVSVSNAGRRRGRGKNMDRKGKRNLNAGQVLGDGKIKVLWPGLNYEVLGSRGISKIEKLPEEVKRITPPVSHHIIKKIRSVHPLDRGWSGKSLSGKKFGPPKSTYSDSFEGFESIVVELKMYTEMTGTLGRRKTYRTLVVIGNGNGVVGVGKAKRIDAMTCISLAKTKASKRLLSIDLIDKHTVNHDFFSEYGRTRMVVLKQPRGYGLHCHRIIKAICEVVGIKDLYAKVYGPSNAKHIVRAFIIGLLRQKTYQDIADEKKLHLVEFREEKLNFPHVLASPEQCLTPTEARKDMTAFEEYIMGGKLRYDPGPKVPFYMKLPSWNTYLLRTLYFRNHEKVRVELIMKYGECKSHLTKVYPECRSEPLKKKEEKVEEQ